MTANLRTHIDLDMVDATPWACGPYTRRALVAATRALIAICDDQLRHVDCDDLAEPWASAHVACEPFRRPVPTEMPSGFTDEEPW